MLKQRRLHSRNHACWWITTFGKSPLVDLDVGDARWVVILDFTMWPAILMHLEQGTYGVHASQTCNASTNPCLMGASKVSAGWKGLFGDGRFFWILTPNKVTPNLLLVIHVLTGVTTWGNQCNVTLSSVTFEFIHNYCILWYMIGLLALSPTSTTTHFSCILGTVLFTPYMPLYVSVREATVEGVRIENREERNQGREDAGTIICDTTSSDK